jgi:cytochrome c oxidase subunit 1
MGAFVLGFSSIFTGLNFIVTIHKMRAPGQSWFRLPLFVWALYSTALIQVLATPVIGITLLMLVVERLLHIGIFDPALGGDPVLFQHFFWFYSHPAVYIMVVPAFGVIGDIIPIFSRKRIFGYKFIAVSSLAIAFLGFLVWGHHMFVSGQSVLAGSIFSAITFLIAIPTAIKVFNWITTMYKGKIHLDTPMLYALAFLWVFTIGGLTGIFLAVMNVDIHLHDTYFVVAHFHYVMMGGAITALMGGIHYWWPKAFGRMYNEKLGRIASLLVFAGLNITFFPQFIMGTRGMPRPTNYLPSFRACISSRRWRLPPRRGLHHDPPPPHRQASKRLLASLGGMPSAIYALRRLLLQLRDAPGRDTGHTTATRTSSDGRSRLRAEATTA